MNRITGSIIVRVVGGGFIVFQGISIFQMNQAEEPTNGTLMLTIAAVFVVLGGLFVILGLRALFKKPKATEEESQALEGGEQGAQEGSLVPPKEESGPKKPKSLRERAMMGGGDDEAREEADLSLQNTDVDIASEDIIAATEEFIATEESENTIATLNQNEGEEGAGSEPAQDTIDNGMTKVIR